MENDLQAKTKKELVDYAKHQGLSGYAKMNKSELVQFLLKNRNKVPTRPASSVNAKERV